MRTLLIRELRQWWVVAAAGGILLSIGLGLSLYRIESPVERPLWLGIETLLNTNVQGWGLVCSAILGLLLGFLTVFIDQHPDQWAFLIHRPVTIRRIFWAKALAAATLLIATTAPPLWMAAFGLPRIQGVVAPFDFGMLTPGLVDIGSGVTYLFAGMLIGSREARWHGTRLWPALAAIAFSVFTIIVPSPCAAGLIVGIGWLVLGSAALFNFEARGEWQALTDGGKSCTAAMASLAGAVVLLVVGFVAAITVTVTRSPDSREWESYYLSEKGTFHRIVHSNGKSIAIINREGQRRNLSEGQMVESVLGPKLEGIVLERAATEPTPGVWRIGYRDTRRYHWPLMRSGQELWYFRMSDGRIHGYDLRGKSHLGSFGPMGFAAPGQRVEPADRFEVPSPTQTLSLQNVAAALVAGNEMYLFSALDKSLHRVGGVPVSERIRAWGGSFERTALWRKYVRENERTSNQIGKTSGNWIAYATDDATYLVDPNGGQRRVEAMRTYGEPWEMTIWVGKPDGASFLQYGPAANIGSAKPAEEGSNGTLLEIDSAGRVASIQPVPGINQHFMKPDPLRNAVKIAVEDVILPPVVRGILNYSRANVAGSSVSVPVEIVTILASAAAMMLLGVRWGFERRETLGWLILVGCMGPAALIAAIGIRNRAVKEACSACGHAEDVSKEHCRACGAVWKSLPLKGTEILRSTMPQDWVGSGG